MVRPHRSYLVRAYLKSLQGKIWVERLPTYAAELNTVEYLWGHWKQHELPTYVRVIFGNSSVGPLTLYVASGVNAPASSVPFCIKPNFGNCVLTVRWQ